MTCVVTFTYSIPGTIGNGTPLALSSAGNSIGSGTFSGGVDLPSSPAPVIDTGTRVFDVAADKWKKDTTNGITALQDICDSEWGLFWVARNGAYVWHNRMFVFSQVSATPSLNLNGGQATITADQGDDKIWNKVTVKYSPRAQLVANQIVAQSKQALQIPALTIGGIPGVQWLSQAPQDRANSSAPLIPGTKTIQLPFIDPTTGSPMGAQSVIPLVPYTDYRVNEQADGSGVDYTPTAGKTQQMFITAAIVGSAVELTFTNKALGPLYILGPAGSAGLQVRGTGLVTYNPNTVVLEDVTSENTYGKNDTTLTLTLSSGQVFAEGLCAYWLNRYKNPRFRATALEFKNQRMINSVHLMSVEIGSVIEITDFQQQFNAAAYLVTGVSYSWDAATSNISVKFFIRDLDANPYWKLGDPEFGVLGQTTRLAM